MSFILEDKCKKIKFYWGGTKKRGRQKFLCFFFPSKSFFFGKKTSIFVGKVDTINCLFFFVKFLGALFLSPVFHLIEPWIVLWLQFCGRNYCRIAGLKVHRICFFKTVFFVTLCFGWKEKIQLHTVLVFQLFLENKRCFFFFK